MTGRFAEVGLPALPDETAVNKAVENFARAVRKFYGDRVRGIYLFGSRARGDHSPDSDADIAVVLASDRWDFWTERMHLADLEYDVIVETEVDVQGWPISERQWREPNTHRNPALVHAMQRDACPIEQPHD